MDYYSKYLKYKNKYLSLKRQNGGGELLETIGKLPIYEDDSTTLKENLDVKLLSIDRIPKIIKIVSRDNSVNLSYDIPTFVGKKNILHNVKLSSMFLANEFRSKEYNLFARTLTRTIVPESQPKLKYTDLVRETERLYSVSEIKKNDISLIGGDDEDLEEEYVMIGNVKLDDTKENIVIGLVMNEFGLKHINIAKYSPYGGETYGNMSTELFISNIELLKTINFHDKNSFRRLVSPNGYNKFINDLYLRISGIEKTTVTKTRLMELINIK